MQTIQVIVLTLIVKLKINKIEFHWFGRYIPTNFQQGLMLAR